MSSLPGILLVNLGSPDSTSVPDVRKYLAEFLMDKRVIDIPFLIRKLLVSGFILPKRPRESAEAYQSIWWEEGSPLIVLSRRLRDQLQLRTEAPVALGMRYGNPSIASALEQLRSQKIDEIRLLPLYPHYAMSSYETVVVKVQAELQKMNWKIPLKVLPPFYKEPQYIDALIAASQEHLSQDYDFLLFSYHGIPVRHLQRNDPTQQHCYQQKDCCNTPSEAHAYCYKHQALETTRAFVEKAGIPAEKYGVSFQSRLGRTPWLEPYTDFKLKEFPEQGIRKLLVICPSFVSDCLETLEEIQIRGREDFLAAGGESLTQIPCMNTHEKWVETLADWVHEGERFLPPIQGERILSSASY